MDNKTALYLREFFQNHFNKKEHQQNINIFLSAFEVINEVVENFAHKHSINHEKAHPSHDLQAFSQHLYLNLQTIFEWVETNIKQQREEQDYIQKSELFWTNKCTDDELYGILNQYKIGNKKLKESLKIVQQKHGKVEEQNKQLCSEVNRISFILEEKARELEEQLKEKEEVKKTLNEKICEIHKLKQQHVETLEQLSKQKQEINALEVEINKKQEMIKGKQEEINILTKELRRTQSAIEKKVQQSMFEIDSKIDEKVGNKENWKMGANESLKRVLLYLKKST